jgi:hypothetical protein
MTSHIIRPIWTSEPDNRFSQYLTAWRIIPEGNNAVIFNSRLHISADRRLEHQRSYLITGEEPLKGKRKCKRKVHPGIGHEAPGAEQRCISVLAEMYLCSFFKLGARRGGWSTLRPGQFTPGKETRYCHRVSTHLQLIIIIIIIMIIIIIIIIIIQEAEWVPRPVWTCTEKLVSTRIRTADRPARSESLNQLYYHCPKTLYAICYLEGW